MKRVAFHNLGCKVNAYETEAMLEQLRGEGYEIVPFEEEADVYVINTCTVTNMADRKSRQMIHRARGRNPQALVVAVGCYVQANPQAVLAEGYADLVVGNDQKSRLAELIRERTSAALDVNQVREYEPLSLKESSGHTRAFIKVTDGCNQFCSYCLIPYVRGRVRSRRPEDVRREVANLAEKGFQEIVLTGIHLSSYGVDFHEEPRTEEFYGTALRRLILMLAEIPKISRIRLGSLEPRIITESFVRELAACPKVCPHFHLSLQSGCESTLRRMNRKYTPGEYYEKCQMLRSYFSHPALTTDVIVGFPGETEKEFEETRRFLAQVRFYETHVFKYSRREGTKAAAMPDQIPEKIKAERSRILLALSKENADVFRSYYLGREEEVLLEEKIQEEDGLYFVGHTREYVKLRVRDEGQKVGQIQKIIVDDSALVGTSG